MPKSKGLLVLAAFLTLILLGTGCEMLAFSEAEPEEQVVAEGKIPQWLLAEHRLVSSADDRDEALLPKDNDEEEEEPAEETAEPEPAEEAAVTQPQEPDPAPQQQETAPPADSAEEPAQEQPEKERVSNQKWQGGTYSGDWQDGTPNGRGTFFHPSGAELTGTWVNGNPDGQFRLTDATGKSSNVHFDKGSIVENGGSNWWSPGGNTGGGWF